MRRTLLVIFVGALFFSHCQKLQDLAISKWEKKNQLKPVKEEDIEKWSEKLALEEAEIEELEKKIRKLVQKSNQAGALSWKIARAYMRSGSFEIGSRYYSQAIMQDSGINPEFEIHKFQSAIPYFEQAIAFKKIDKELLFETALAFGNASKDMGWEPDRRSRAINLFKQLILLDPKDTRFPFQLALIYFDSGVKSSQWQGKTLLSFTEMEDAFLLLDQILILEPYNVPARFARANFLYQTGKVSQAETEYIRIKSQIEDMTKQGAIRESLEKNQSYQNVLKNLDRLRNQPRL